METPLICRKKKTEKYVFSESTNFSLTEGAKSNLKAHVIGVYLNNSSLVVTAEMIGTCIVEYGGCPEVTPAALLLHQDRVHSSTALLTTLIKPHTRYYLHCAGQWTY